MTEAQVVRDARTLGFDLTSQTIGARNQATGWRLGATVTVEHSERKATWWAHLSTPLSRRSQMRGKSVLIVTVVCTSTTLHRQVHIKHELVARRFADALNREAAQSKGSSARPGRPDWWKGVTLGE